MMNEHLSAMKSRLGLEHKPKPAAAPQIAPEFRRQLAGAVESYLVMQQALAGDDHAQAIEAAKAAEGAIGSVDMKLLKGDDRMAWMKPPNGSLWWASRSTSSSAPWPWIIAERHGSRWTKVPAIPTSGRPCWDAVK